MRASHDVNLSAMTLTLIAAALGCGSGSAGSETPDAGSALRVTYYQDVAPILHAKCVTCHYPGGIAPFALDTPETAVPVAGLVKDATASRLMPPWPPGPLSPKLLHDRSLTDAQIATLAAWADGGAAL